MDTHRELPVLENAAMEPEIEEKIRARSIAYKSALRVFLDQITPDDLEKIT